VIGTIQLVGVLADKTSIDNYQPFKLIASVNLGGIGYWIVGSFVLAWVFSIVVWKVGRYEEGYSSGIVETEHIHQELKVE
jgi:high-affinity nickel-transport protein